MIRGYFSVVAEVARLYTDVSHQYIIPGVHLMDRLGLSQIGEDSDNLEIVRRNEELAVYKENAVTKIRELAGMVRTIHELIRKLVSLTSISTAC